MAKDPAFLLYYKDFKQDTEDWEPEAVGWYIRLLCFQAGNGYIPSNVEEIASVANVKFSQYQNFQELWKKRISAKFSDTLSDTQKLQNEKLARIQSDRKENAIKKSVLAVFGNFIKSTDLSNREVSYLKVAFKKSDRFEKILDPEKRKETIIKFLEIELINYKNSKQRNTKRTHLANVNENVNEKENTVEEEIKKFTKRDFRKILLDLGVNKKHLEDWFKVRDKKKAVNTETALTTFINECNNHDFPVADAVKICAEKSWSGFKYKWLENSNHPKTQQNGKSSFATNR